MSASSARRLTPRASLCEARRRGLDRPRRWPSHRPSMRLRRTRTGMNRRLFLGGLRPPKPSRGRGVGKPGFPLPLRESQARPRAGRGETRFPYTPA